MVMAGLMLAHQVASKAARDALFLSQFDISYFPRMVVVGSAISIVGGLLNSRILQILTPARMVPWTLLFSGTLHLVEWGFRSGPYRPAMIVVMYIHVVGLGAIVLSSFWSLLNEQFDPRSGKKYFGRIAGTGTLGGIFGGVAAERFATLLPPTSILLFLGGVHLLCGCISFLLVTRSRQMAASEHPIPAESHDHQSSRPWKIFQGSKYLQMLAGLVVLGTTTAALLDIVFKTQAATLIGRGPALLRFFAIFYTAAQVLTFAVQILVTRKWLEKQGLARGIGSLPAVVTAGGIGALIFPLFPVLVVTRALEIIFRGSIYRAGYELLYTPLSVREKRAAKPVVDVVVDRLGDVLGGSASQLFLALGGAFAVKGILVVAVALAGLGMFITRQLGRLYVRVLEKGLMERAVELDVSEDPDFLTRSVLLKTLTVKRTLATQPDVPTATAPISQDHPVRHTDPLLQRLADMRSGNLEIVRRELGNNTRMDSLLTPQVIVLLAWDDIAPDAIRTLSSNVGQITGQLVDALLDKDGDFAIRRRIPRALAYSNDSRAVQGLFQALDDSRFEVRFQCARALDVIIQRNPQHRPEREKVFAIIERELSVGRQVWESRRLLDQRLSSEQFLFLDDILRERANLSWEHLFTLLALILPREPLKVAFQALHTEDRQLRGLALEYLDSVLPPSLHRVQSIFETVAISAPATAGPTDLATRLLEARQSVSLKLANAVPPPVTRTGD
jgi:ATP:ADP antiporter, AAA family